MLISSDISSDSDAKEMAKKLASCNCKESFGRLLRQYVSKDADWADDKIFAQEIFDWIVKLWQSIEQSIWPNR